MHKPGRKAKLGTEVGMSVRIMQLSGLARFLGTVMLAGALVFLIHGWMQKAPTRETGVTLPASAAASLRGYPLQAGQSVVFIPAAAHATGAAGTNWRSDVEIHNPGTTPAAYTIALLKRDTNNASPTTKSFTLNPGLSVRYTDILSSMFAFSGAAALQISVTSGTILASSRTYNLMLAGNPLNLPAGATFGQFVPAFTASEATSSTEQARLIQLAHSRASSGFRTNIGYLNTTNTTLTMITDLYTAAGTKLGTYNDSLPPFGYKQVDKIFEKVTTQDVADGYAIVRTTTTGGTFFAYASVIDNPTGDPTFVPAERVGASAGTYIEIGRATIGPAGGTLAGDGFTLTVPPGAFASNATVVLTKGDAAAAASAPYARYAISPLYGIDGLPDTFTQPLTITITLTGSSTGNRYVALTEAVFSPSAAGVIQGPMLLDATAVGANQLRAIIPATPSGSGAAPSDGLLASGWTNRELLVETRPAFSVRAISGIYAQETADGRFRIYYPAADLITGGSDAILDALSNAYTKLQGLGLSWAGRTRWPIQAEMYSFPADERDRDAQETPSRLGVNYHWLAFNLDRIGGTADVPRMKVAAGHELFHLMQFLYDPRNRWTQARQPGTWLWLDEASATWFESLMAGSDSYVPGTVREDNYSFLVRHGLEYPPGDPSNVQGHGYGASMFLKHLTKSKGNTFVGDLYKLHPNASYTPVDAISRTLGSSTDTEIQWKLFTEGWTEGRIYPGTTFPSLTEVLGSKSDTYTFDSQDDTGQTFTWNAPDLAARACVVNLRYTGWQPGTSLPISLTDPNKSAQAVIYKYKSGDVAPTRLGHIKDRENYDVANAEQLVRDGYSLLIVVANGRNQNPYAATSPIELKVGFGTIAFRLSWGGVEDLDLHVQEPNGTEIDYSNTGPTSTGGRLDTDCNGPCSHQCASPVENVYWPSGGAPSGTYRFWVHYYSACTGGGGKTFTLKVFVNGQLKQTYNDTLAGEGAKSTVYSYTL